MIDAEMVTGDVELHMQGAQWEGHRHHTDLDYNGVILHVVFNAGDERTSDRLHNGDALPRIELEPYLLFKTIKLKFRFKEAPVTKIYPPRKLGYTKMKPIVGWWSILKPVIYLGCGFKK